MMHRFGSQPLSLEPYAGASVQLRKEIGVGFAQPLAQYVSKEMMVAVPSPLFVQRDHEQVRVLEVLQGFLAVIPGGHRVTERAAHPVEDGGLEQEGPQRFRLAREQLFDQV